MQQFTLHTGSAMPLRRTDVDTDQIIPTRFVPYFSRTGYTNALFADWRDDPNFVLNLPQYGGATILVAGNDFGTGSSREHAVWALRDYGFQAVISSRFADIFRGNSGKQGLLAAQVDQADVELLWKLIEEHPGTEIEVDLESRTVTCDTVTVPFTIDDYTRWRLMEGLDDIGLTLQREEDIAAFEAGRPAFKPTTLPART